MALGLEEKLAKCENLIKNQELHPLESLVSFTQSLCSFSMWENFPSHNSTYKGIHTRFDRIVVWMHGFKRFLSSLRCFHYVQLVSNKLLSPTYIIIALEFEDDEGDESGGVDEGKKKH